jgi:hypothetical protein
MASCVTCFISCWNIWGVSLFRMERTLRNRSCKGEGTEDEGSSEVLKQRLLKQDNVVETEADATS